MNTLDVKKADLMGLGGVIMWEMLSCKWDQQTGKKHKSEELILIPAEPQF